MPNRSLQLVSDIVVYVLSVCLDQECVRPALPGRSDLVTWVKVGANGDLAIGLCPQLLAKPH